MKISSEKEQRSTIPTQELLNKIQESLIEKMGRDIKLIDVRGRSHVVDYYLMVTGTSTPHLKAMFDGVQHDLKQDGIHCYRRAGEPQSGWMVIDYVDVVIHILSTEAREYYALEELWEKALSVDPATPHPASDSR